MKVFEASYLTPLESEREDVRLVVEMVATQVPGASPDCLTLHIGSVDDEGNIYPLVTLPWVEGNRGCDHLGRFGNAESVLPAALMLAAAGHSNLEWLPAVEGVVTKDHLSAPTGAEFTVRAFARSVEAFVSMELYQGGYCYGTFEVPVAPLVAEAADTFCRPMEAHTSISY
jgi:hypothetical protein